MFRLNICMKIIALQRKKTLKCVQNTSVSYRFVEKKYVIQHICEKSVIFICTLFEKSFTLCH
jgi:hypothetical protein